MCRGAAVLAICNCRRDRETLPLLKKYILIKNEIIHLLYVSMPAPSAADILI